MSLKTIGVSHYTLIAPNSVSCRKRQYIKKINYWTSEDRSGRLARIMLAIIVIILRMEG